MVNLATVSNNLVANAERLVALATVSVAISCPERASIFQSIFNPKAWFLPFIISYWSIYYPYWQYTDLFIFRFVSLLCLRSTLRLLCYLPFLVSPYKHIFPRSHNQHSACDLEQFLRRWANIFPRSTTQPV